ncbi:MAG: hypothetical protein V3T63_01595 [Nitrosopumilaceae archaeon]
MELTDSQKYGAIFGGAFVAAGLVLSILVFPFWNLIREDVFEETEILSNVDGVCYVDTSDNIPKTIRNCDLQPGTLVTVKFGEGLAWATIVNPDSGN